MSGIAGIIHFDGKPIEPGLIEKMTGAMAHRGPDGINHWVKGSVALGQCMLRTTPESLEEHQPLTNEDESLILVMDGRVDNWEELRKELLGRGAVLRTRADAELVLRAYEIWGENCPRYVIGEFAFFVWDVRNKKLFGLRDAAGTHHFYYHGGNSWFCFASEIKGILALGLVDVALNEWRLLDYLVVAFDRDDEVGTFYQGIKRLPAGHAMRVTDREVKPWRYWHPGELPALTYISSREYSDALLEQLSIAVKCRVRALGPIGAALSGGMDSSSIVGLIDKQFRSEVIQPLYTFSLVKHDRENCSDWSSISEVLSTSGSLEPTIISSRISRKTCQSFLNHLQDLDEPFGWNFCDSLVFDAASQRGCKVLFEGMGGDLLFYHPGNSLDYAFRAGRYSLIPGLLRACNRHGVNKYCLRKVFWSTLSALAPHPIRRLYRKLRRNGATGGTLRNMEGSLFGWLGDGLAERLLARKRHERQGGCAYGISANDSAYHSQNFVTGCLSFAHEVNGQIAYSKGVELRSPFSDRRIIEFAVRIPVEWKLSMPWYKHLLRQATVGRLPEDVRWRRSLWEHPGWSFNQALLAEMDLISPGFVDLERTMRFAERWIKTSCVARALVKYDRDKDYTLGYSLLVLMVLVRWLEARPNLVAA